MSYSGGCIVGVCIHDPKVYFGGGGRLESGITVAQMQSMATYNTSNNPQKTWPTFDGAWTPGVEVVNTFGSNPKSVWCVAETHYIWRGHGAIANGLLACGDKDYGLPSRVAVYNDANNAFVAYTQAHYLEVLDFGGLSTYPSSFKTLVVDIEDQAQGSYLGLEWYSSGLATTSSSLWREVAPMLYVELPNNQELVSYKRADIAPSSEKVMTLDGASRRYVTGYGSTSIDATWRWSDNGYAASWLRDILGIAMDKGEPLVIYMPQGRWGGVQTLDLVVCDTPPEVTMVAPGVYELHIVGTCQP